MFERKKSNHESLEKRLNHYKSKIRLLSKERDKIESQIAHYETTIRDIKTKYGKRGITL